MNPFLPLKEYIPDGEPHVFGDRVYLYGSHDKARSDRFCVQDYTVWSAPVDDLSNWECHGVTYRKEQDPRSKTGKLVDFYAPDCVQGPDGRFYLYYFAAGPNASAFGPMSVAVSDHPQGPFSYLSDIQYPDGTPMLQFLTNDPAVLNDDGRIWLYYGWGLGHDFRSPIGRPIYDLVLQKLCNRSKEAVKDTKPSILSCAVVELESDMYTVKAPPKAVLDSKTTAPKGSPLYDHPFYEAPSIRKLNDLYYLVYSSGENNELAYATSRYPDRDFTCRGVIISNSDLGYQGNRQRKAPAGTIHGGMECINGRYYIFYHRCTNNTDFSRQACAEPIEILPGGEIRQVEMTTQGMGAPMKAEGSFEAALCCNLYHAKTRHVQGNGHRDSQPNVGIRNSALCAASITNGTVIGFKYFDFHGPKHLAVTVCGSSGVLKVYTDLSGVPLAEIPLTKSGQWTEAQASLSTVWGVHPLYFVYCGKGKIHFLRFRFF